MKTLSHDQKVICQNTRMTICTAAGIKKDLEASGDDSWVDPEEEPGTIKESTCISGDKGYYEREDAKWANAIEIEEGETIMFADDERVFKVKVVGLNYSDPIHFIYGD